MSFATHQFDAHILSNLDGRTAKIVHFHCCFEVSSISKEQKDIVHISHKTTDWKHVCGNKVLLSNSSKKWTPTLHFIHTAFSEWKYNSMAQWWVLITVKELDMTRQDYTVSRPRVHRTQMQGQFRFKNVHFKQQQVEDLHTEQINGLWNSWALSSINMVEESAAMKINKQKPLHSRRKTKGYEW